MHIGNMAENELLCVIVPTLKTNMPQTKSYVIRLDMLSELLKNFHY